MKDKKLNVKTLMTIMIVTGVLFVLSACQQTVDEPDDKNVRFSGITGNITIVTDNETGCKYIREDAGSTGKSLTALLKEDGTPNCGKSWNKMREPEGVY